EGDESASCGGKDWQEVATELLGEGEPELCKEADEQLALTSESSDDSDDNDDAELALEDVSDATSVVGVGRDGETVILVDKDDEEIFAFLEAAYPDATVEISGEFEPLA